MKLPVDFAKAVVWAWTKHYKLGAALTYWKGVTITDDVTSSMWKKWLIEAALDPHTHVGQDITSWVAKHFAKANACLWDGKTELAWKWMASGKDTQPVRRARPNTQIAREVIRETRETHYISARSLDKKHDWNTVK